MAGLQFEAIKSPFKRRNESNREREKEKERERERERESEREIRARAISDRLLRGKKGLKPFFS